MAKLRMAAPYQPGNYLGVQNVPVVQAVQPPPLSSPAFVGEEREPALSLSKGGGAR